MLRGKPTLKVLTEVGLSGEEVAFWGFANTDIYQCCPVDTLHQCFNGISLHLIEALQMCIEDTCKSRKDVIFAKIRDRLSSYKSLYHGERIPKDSLWAEKTCAEVSVQGTGGSKLIINRQTFISLHCRRGGQYCDSWPLPCIRLMGCHVGYQRSSWVCGVKGPK